jgi:hypothetical protein
MNTFSIEDARTCDAIAPELHVHWSMQCHLAADPLINLQNVNSAPSALRVTGLFRRCNNLHKVSKTASTRVIDKCSSLILTLAMRFAPCSNPVLVQHYQLNKSCWRKLQDESFVAHEINQHA